MRVDTFQEVCLKLEIRPKEKHNQSLVAHEHKDSIRLQLVSIRFCLYSVWILLEMVR